MEKDFKELEYELEQKGFKLAEYGDMVRNEIAYAYFVNEETIFS